MAMQPITMQDLHREFQRFPTKEDLARTETRLIGWMIGITLSAALGSAAIASSITFAVLRLSG